MPPADEQSPSEQPPKKPAPRFDVVSMLPVALGLLLLIGVIAWVFVGKPVGVPDEALAIATEATKLKPEQFEEVNVAASDLKDWFLLHGFDNFSVPAEFESAHVAGTKIIKSGNHPVAVLYFPEKELFLVAFDPAPLRMSPPSSDKWATDPVDETHSAAIKNSGGMCAMVVAATSRENLAKLLEKSRSGK